MQRLISHARILWPVMIEERSIDQRGRRKEEEEEEALNFVDELKRTEQFCGAFSNKMQFTLLLPRICRRDLKKISIIAKWC